MVRSSVNQHFEVVLRHSFSFFSLPVAINSGIVKLLRRYLSAEHFGHAFSWLYHDKLKRPNAIMDLMVAFFRPVLQWSHISRNQFTDDLIHR